MKIIIVYVLLLVAIFFISSGFSIKFEKWNVISFKVDSPLTGLGTIFLSLGLIFLMISSYRNGKRDARKETLEILDEAIESKTIESKTI